MTATFEEKLSLFYQAIVRKREPELARRMDVSFDASLVPKRVKGKKAKKNPVISTLFRCSRGNGNGKAVVRFGVLPNHPDLELILQEVFKQAVRVTRKREPVKMLPSERTAWQKLIVLGARECEFGGKRALDLRSVKITRPRDASLILAAARSIVIAGGSNSFQFDEKGDPIYVLTSEEK